MIRLIEQDPKLLSSSGFIKEKIPDIKEIRDEDRFQVQVNRCLPHTGKLLNGQNQLKKLKDCKVLPDQQTAESFGAVTKMTDKTPNEDRDSRYFTRKALYLMLVQVILSIITLLTSLDGVKNSGGFSAWQ